MASIINTNISSLTAQRNLSRTQMSLSTAIDRLSSGLRINSAKDDAAGLAISNRLTSQINGLNQAARNSNDAISLAQTADSALNEISDNLQRMRELAVQAANDTNSATDRASIQKEISQLQAEIDRVGNTLSFNGNSLLDGTFAGKKFQVGAFADQTISVTLSDARTSAIGNNRIGSSYMGTMNSTDSAGRADRAAVNTAGAGSSGTATQVLTIAGPNGNAVTGTIATNSSAQTVAAAVNAVASTTGVYAEAVTKASLSTITATGTYTFGLFGTNTTVQPVSATISNTADLSPLVSAINGQSVNTGITASIDTSSNIVTLTQAQGAEITIQDFALTGGAASSVTFRTLDGFTNAGVGTAITLSGATGSTTDSTRAGGTLRYNSSGSFTLQTSAGTTIVNTTSVISSTLSTVSAIDVGTQSGANSAIGVLDGALSAINAQRATLGALQNRVVSTIANLESSSENLAAARSRILDADFAQETANLTRAQILQQAGTAMVAQANAQPQSVLSLLKG